MTTTSPTTYAMVNALNTIPSSLFSALFFTVVVTWKSAGSIALGLASGVMYSVVKFREQQAKAVKKTSSNSPSPLPGP